MSLHPVFPCLRKRDAVVHTAPFQARIPWRLARLDAAKERFERKVYPHGDVLQHLAMHFTEFGVKCPSSF